MPAVPVAVNAPTNRAGSVQIDTPGKLCDAAGKHAVRATVRSQHHVPGLGHRRHRARLYRAVVPGGELWRPPAHHACKLGAASDLSAITCDLLHVVDVLRLGRTRIPLRL